MSPTSGTQQFRCMRLCAVPTLANQKLQRISDEPQEFRARGTSAHDDMDWRGTDAIFGEHFNGDNVSPRSARPPWFGSRPDHLELVLDSFNVVVMLVDRHLDFSLRHGGSFRSQWLLGSREVEYQAAGQKRRLENLRISRECGRGKRECSDLIRRKRDHVRGQAKHLTFPMCPIETVRFRSGTLLRSMRQEALHERPSASPSCSRGASGAFDN